MLQLRLGLNLNHLAERGALNKTSIQGSHRAILAFLMIGGNTPLFSAEEIVLITQTDYGWVWNLLVVVIILAVSAASAALTIAALKQWYGHWRWAAVFPFFILAFWILIIIGSRLFNDDAHRLWPLEIFAWAMLNLIYMQILMIAKKNKDKVKEQNNSN
jgi:hypothetical protein